MKVEFFDSEFGASICLTPETLEEVAWLIRISKNASAVKPDIYLSFGSVVPLCEIWLKKRSKKAQVQSIRPS